MKSALSLNVTGPESEKALVFIHGFMGSSADFLPLINLLQNNYLCAAVDLPGHGNSLYAGNKGLAEITGFKSLAAAILNELNNSGVWEFSLYGYSMGGRAAQSVALEAPQRTENLILESSSFGIEDEKEREKRLMDDIALLDEVNDKESFLNFLKNWHSSALFSTLAEAGIRDKIIESKLLNSAEELRKGMQLLSVGNQPFFLHRLMEAGVKTSYLCGLEDKKYSGIGINAKKKYPDINLIPFEKASHNIHAEYPGEVASVIKKIMG